MRVLIIDDEVLVRECIVRALASEGVDVCEASTTDQGLAVVNKQAVDVIILKHNLGGERLDGIAAAGPWTRLLHKTLILSGWMSEMERRRLVKVGVHGIFSRRRKLTDLLDAIHRVASGGDWFDERPERGTRPWKAKLDLTEQEERATSLVVDGLSNKEVGDRMGISENHVKGLLQRVYLKAGVHSRGQLIRIAIEDQGAMAGNDGGREASADCVPPVNGGMESALVASDELTRQVPVTCPLAEFDCALLHSELLKRYSAVMEFLGPRSRAQVDHFAE